MADEIAPTAPEPEGTDIEARLRRALVSRADDAPVTPADWGGFTGRLASATRRRRRVLVGAAGLALIVGAAGGYFGEAAASPGSIAARAPGVGSTPSTTVPGQTGLAAPSEGPAVMCPDIPGASSGASSGTSAVTNGAGSIGSAPRLFVRSTADGVTIRVYQDAPAGGTCPGVPTPSAGSGAPGSSSSGPATSAPSTTTVASGPTLMPLTPFGPGATIELSTDDAVGQGDLSSPPCVVSPGSGTTNGSTTGSGGEAGSSPASPPGLTPGGGEPVTTIPPTTIPVTTVPTTANAPGQPQVLSTGTFGVVEGDPVWWVAVEVSGDVTSVQMTFPDGSTDQMAPVGGVAVLAHRVSPAVAAASTGPYVVRGSLQLLGANGDVVATVDLPQTSTSIGGPVPLNQSTPSVAPGVMRVCPPETVTPQAQSSAPTEKR